MNPMRVARISESRLSLSRVMSSPAKIMLPEVGRSRQPTRFKSVLFPDPEEPITDTKSPCGTSSVTLLRALTVSLSIS